MPTHRSIQFAAVVYRYAAELGIAPEALLAHSGLDECDFDDPDLLVTPAQEFSLLRNLSCSIGDPDLGFELGERSHLGTLGPLGVATASCETLGAALETFRRLADLLGSYFRFEMRTRAGAAVLMICERLDLKEARRLVCEREFASVRRVFTDLIGVPVDFTEIRVAYVAPRNGPRYAQRLGCPVVFGAATNAVVFDARWLDHRLPLANPLTLKAAERACESALDRVRANGPLSQRIVQEVLFRGDGPPALDEMARLLNISSRTLRRRLNDEGVTYRDVVTRLQFDEAVRLLKTTTLPIRDVAQVAGYGDLPNFYRAFRRRTGTTPGAYRSAGTSR
ncbi:AraC family transcriptional regulator [Streptomyces sp. NPDC002623]